MADDEQFSLCWNNFNSNLSAGFHESLCRGDLVDVTLAAEGQFVKAHRLVLSVCSPYFRKMFTQMPANQHAFVFLKDVSHTALKDLIQFMYCGEVNVKQEALPAFISTAEALQIKGLTDSDPAPSQSPADEPPTPTPQQQQATSPRQRQRTTTTRSYKIETVDDSGDDNKVQQQPTQIVIQTTAAAPQVTLAQHHHQQTQHHLQQSQQPQQHLVSSAAVASTSTATVVTHKRPAQRISGSNIPHIKRTKSTIDPLDTTDASTATASQQITVQTAVVSETKVLHQQQQQQQQSNESEYIELPIELPTKSEPEYTEDAGEVEATDNDDAYVEDDSYGDIRYDSYFTENEDVGNTTATAATVGVSAGSVGTGSTNAAATTSKAIVKQQASTSFTDSSFVEAADQSNNDAQGKPEAQVKRKRGRPVIAQKLLTDKLIDRLAEATNSGDGKPIIYASTTKGAMKVLYDGHHFKYSFRKGPYSIFQCCYKENKDECKVRVVCHVDKKRVFPLDGEHAHFMKATDKSVTNVSFESGEIFAENEESIGHEDEHLASSVHVDAETSQEPSHEPSHFEVNESFEVLNTTSSEAVDFREKIKKRLQKALLGKKK